MDQALFSSASSLWQTPVGLLSSIAPLARRGEWSIDPCSGVGSRVRARVAWGPSQDGLSRPWSGRVFVNPPYGREVAAWIEKCRSESMRGVEIVALVAARPDTRWFQDCGASAVCFLRGRLLFSRPGCRSSASSPAPFPSALLYYGSRLALFWRVAGRLCRVVPWYA